jgi:hypothetical protein
MLNLLVPAADFETLQRTYLGIARRLQLPGLEDEQSGAKKLLKDYLCQSSAGQWLLIFDNADDIGMWFGKPEGNAEPCTIFIRTLLRVMSPIVPRVA